MFVITKQWGCKMKLSEKTIQKIINEAAKYSNKRVPYSPISEKDIRDALRNLSFVTKPYDSSQSTLVISGEKE